VILSILLECDGLPPLWLTAQPSFFECGLSAAEQGKSGFAADPKRWQATALQEYPKTIKGCPPPRHKKSQPDGEVRLAE
jgi:hypothetical protein